MTGESSRPTPDDPPVVLGQEYAKALEVESRRPKDRSSPLPVAEYDFWRGETSLLRPAPSVLDDEIRAVCRAYAGSAAGVRAAMRRSISLAQFYTLLCFAGRSAIFGLRREDARLVDDGLTAIAMIELRRIDWRDVFWPLGLLIYAAQMTGGDAKTTVRRAARLAELRIADILTARLENLTAGDYLRGTGFAAVSTDQGVGFINRSHHPYDASLDLPSALVELADRVTSDVYQPDWIELADSLPAIWIVQDRLAVRSTLPTPVRALARLSAKLRPGHPANIAAQFLLIYLVETENSADARQLALHAHANRAQDFARLAVTRDRLFCLVIGRSDDLRFDRHETDESLKRFDDQVSAILERYTNSNE